MRDRIKCAACGSQLSRSPESNTSRFRCPKCKAILRVSGFDESTTIVEQRTPTPTVPQPGDGRNSGSRLTSSASVNELSKSATSVDPVYPPLIANPPSPAPRRSIGALIGFAAGVAICAILFALMVNQGIVTVGVGGARVQEGGKAPKQIANDQPVIRADQEQPVPNADEKPKAAAQPDKPKAVRPFAFGSLRIKSARWFGVL